MKKFQVNIVEEEQLKDRGFRRATDHSWWRFDKKQVGDITIVFAVNVDLKERSGVITAFDKANPRETRRLGKLILSYIDNNISLILEDLKESGIASE